MVKATLLFLFLSFVASAQLKQAAATINKDTVSTPVKIPPTMEARMMEIEQQSLNIKSKLGELEAEAKRLLTIILEANNIDTKTVYKIDYKKGELLVKHKKQ